MVKNPFVWKSLHLALLAVKDEQIRALREEVSVARTDRLRAETARDVAIAKAFEVMTPKPVEAPPAPEPRAPRAARPPRTLDLAEVDPSDNLAIRDLALSEMPAGKASGGLLLQKMESLRAQVMLARIAKQERAKQVGTLSAPESVMARIEAAEQEGKDRARVQ